MQCFVALLCMGHTSSSSPRCSQPPTCAVRPFLPASCLQQPPFRCLHRWGLLHQTEPCPFLEQLSSLLQSQLDLDDASAPAEVAGLQCHVANRCGHTSPVLGRLPCCLSHCVQAKCLALL